MLNKELSHFAENNKSGAQISDYLYSTYTGEQRDFRNDVSFALTGAIFSADKKEPDVDLTASRGLPVDDTTTVITSRPIDTSESATPTLMGQIIGIHPAVSASASAGTPSRTSVPELGVETAHVDELRTILDRVNDWGLDTFRVEDLSGQRPLTAITYRIFQERLLLRTYAIEPQTLISYLLTLEDHYQQVPYHNKAHGADVCQSMHVLLNASALDVSDERRAFVLF